MRDWAAWGRAAVLAVYDTIAVDQLAVIERQIAEHLRGYAEWSQAKHDALLELLREQRRHLTKGAERHAR